MRFKAWLVALILLFSVCAAYFNSIHNDFLWDDEFLIEKNTFLRSFSNLPKMLVSNSTAGFGGTDNFYRPTQNIYYLVIYQLFGYSKVAFHVGNILLHFINSILIYFLIVRLTSRPRLALISSLLWSTHPTHVEAITYISGTADPMGLMFALLCLLLLPLANFHQHKVSFLFSHFFFIMALLSKEAMVVTPALICLVLAYKNPRDRWKATNYLPSAGYWLLTAIYLFLRKYFLNFNETFEFFKNTNIYSENILYRIYTYLATLPEYLKILFYPTDLHMERSFPVFVNWTSVPVLLGFVIVILSLATVIYLARKKQEELPLFSLLWYFIAFVPMMGILIPVNSFILEHWLYIPSITLFLVIAHVLIKTEAIHKVLPWLLTGVLVLTLISLTHVRNKDWKTPLSFYTNILKYSKGTARVHNNLAMAYSDKKQWTEAIEHYLKAISLADVYPQTQYNLARAYIRIGEYQKAYVHLQRSLEINPDFKYSLRLKNELERFLKKDKR